MLVGTYYLILFSWQVLNDYRQERTNDFPPSSDRFPSIGCDGFIFQQQRLGLWNLPSRYFLSEIAHHPHHKLL